MNSHIEDQYDYYLYGLRKFTLVAFEGLMKVNNDELYKYNAVVKAAIGVCKLALKVKKFDQAKKDTYTAELDEYKTTEEYLTQQKKHAENLE